MRDTTYVFFVNISIARNQTPHTASLGCNRVSNGKTHRCMAKVMYHGKSHGIWVLPYNGLSHGSMVKPMDIMKRYIHGFCHGTLLHGFCHALFIRKVTNCVFTQPGICLLLSLSFLDNFGRRINKNHIDSRKITPMLRIFPDLRDE